MSSIGIVGCGYVGERIARYYQDAGRNVCCLVRSPEHCNRLMENGFTASTCSLDSVPEQLRFSAEGSILFYLVPPPGGGIYDIRARNWIEFLKKGKQPARIVYMSATSVYSEMAGGTVTEDSQTTPLSAMGKRRLDAENAFFEYGKSVSVPVVVLRVSGIYGPGRLPLTQISNRQPLLLEKESGPSNRIHVDDLVSVCIAAAEKGEGGDIFNVSDNHPSSMTSYFNLCADNLGFARQPQVTLEEARKVMSPLMLSYITESRVVDSSRMIDRLGVQLSYQSMMSGVPAACNQSNFP